MSTVRLHRYCSFTMVVGGMLLQDFLNKWTKMCKYHKTLSDSKAVNHINILLYQALYHTCCRPVPFLSVLSLSPFLSHSRPVCTPSPVPDPVPVPVLLVKSHILLADIMCDHRTIDNSNFNHYNAIRRLKSGRYKTYTSKFVKLWCPVTCVSSVSCTARRRICNTNALCYASLQYFMRCYGLHVQPFQNA